MLTRTEADDVTIGLDVADADEDEELTMDRPALTDEADPDDTSEELELDDPPP